MRHLPILLAVVVVMVATSLVAMDFRAPAPPRPPEREPPPTDLSSPEALAAEAFAVSVTPVPAAGPESPVDPRRVELAALLDALRAEQRAGHSLGETLDAIGALLRRHPGLIRALLEIVPDSDRAFRNLLVHAVMKSRNRRLIATLDAAIAEAADPGEKHVKELLAAEPDRIATAIQDLEKPRDRLDLVRGLSRTQVGDPLILAALSLAAGQDPDTRVRRASLIRLGKSGDAQARAKVVAMLHDAVAPARDRAAAAFALSGSVAKDNVDEFLNILRRGDEPVMVMVVAANGLSQSVGRPDVDEILFQRLECREEHDRVRKAAAGSIALGGQRLKGRDRADLEARAYGALLSLGRQSGSEMVHVWSRSQFLDSFGAGFRRLIEPSAESQSSVIDAGD